MPKKPIRNMTPFLCALALVVVACDEEQERSTAEEAVAEAKDEVAEAAGEEGSQEQELDSCAVLTEDAVRGHFELAEDIEVKQSSFDIVHHSCTYKWEKENADEIREQLKKRQKKRVQDMLKNMRKGKKVQGIVDMATDMPSVDNEVTLTLADFELDSEAAAKERFEKNLETLAKGIKRKVETKNIDEEVEFEMKTEPVEGVGERAAWSERMSQLSVLSGTQIFHVVVKIHEEPDDDLEAAKGLAERVIEAL